MIQPVLAAPLEGEKRVLLRDEAGQTHQIGSVRFEAGADGSRYHFTLNDAVFKDHFLSMRPFKCLEGKDKHWCYVPYPYNNRHTVSDRDLTDLEYDLLFVWKGATDYGINMWNGIYYRLAVEDGRLKGTLHEMDMDRLSAPPEDDDFRPLEDKHLHEADPDSHWLPFLIIE
ncbi:hypothetical protein [Coralliovum pocilloporae]|uniref:hypothetical protein n=1 Tax=Coralliovum pocilloporae TaxID=3066369 RepID=UPI003307C594